MDTCEDVVDAVASGTATFCEDPGVFLGYQQVRLDGNSELNLYIGPREALEDVPGLQSRGVTHVVSVMPKEKATCIDEVFQRLVIDAEDDPEWDLKSKFRPACEFIDAALAMNGGVLIHCNAGQSRSGTVLIAYLMHNLHRPLGECLATAQRSRAAVSPNEGFWSQLLAWERDLLGHVTISGGARMHEIRPRLWLGL